MRQFEKALVRCLLTATMGVAIGVLQACTPQAGASAAAAPVEGPVLLRGRVDVPGGLVQVPVVRAGRVAQWLVAEGQHVQAGQLVLTLDNKETQAELALARAEVELAKAQLKAQEVRLPSAIERERRLGLAAQSGAVSGQSVDDAHDSAVDLRQQIGVLRAGLSLAQRKLAQAEAAVNESQVRASVAGQVVQRLAHVGEYAEVHAPILQLLPDGPRLIRAELNEELVDRVKPGMRADVVSANDEGPTQHARVLRIGDVYGPSRTRDPSAPEATDAQFVECWLELDGAPWRVGQRVLVKIQK